MMYHVKSNHRFEFTWFSEADPEARSGVGLAIGVDVSAGNVSDRVCDPGGVENVPRVVVDQLVDDLLPTTVDAGRGVVDPGDPHRRGIDLLPPSALAGATASRQVHQERTNNPLASGGCSSTGQGSAIGLLLLLWSSPAAQGRLRKWSKKPNSGSRPSG